MVKIINPTKQTLLTILVVLSLAVSTNAEDTTYTRILTIAIKDGKAVSPDDEIVAELDGGGIVVDDLTGKQFWGIEEDDSIGFSFVLPKGARNIEAKIQCVSNDSVAGKARVRWNRVNLKDMSDKTKVLEFDGSGNFSEDLSLNEPKRENTLKFVATEGTIGIQSVTIRCKIPFPSWDFDGLVITQTAPAPDTLFDGSPITIKWTYRGLPDGWLQLKYRPKGSPDWRPVPGFEGITFGSAGWNSEHSEFEWKNPPPSSIIQFEFVYIKGKNPIDVHADEIDRQNRIAAETIADL